MTLAMNPRRMCRGELQKCLNDRGVVVSHERRASLKDLFIAAPQRWDLEGQGGDSS